MVSGDEAACGTRPDTSDVATRRRPLFDIIAPNPPTQSSKLHRAETQRKNGPESRKECPSRLERNTVQVQYDTYAEKLQDHCNAPLLCPDVLNANDYTFCPWATTLTGFDVNSECWVAVAITCKRWGCPWCAVKKVRRLAWMSRNAQPNKLLTVTVSDKRYANGKEAWEATSKAFPELIRWVRKERGECEYMRVLELQNNGMPHFHCLLRCNYIPFRQILRAWRDLIGKPREDEFNGIPPKEWAGVNLKKIDESFATFRYLVKYLTKLHKIEWTDRHVSYSRGFFNPADLEEVAYAKLDSIEQYDQHPWVWLQERYSGNAVRVLSHEKWELPDYPYEPMGTVDPASLGLPTTENKLLPSTYKQRLVPGIEESIPGENEHLSPDGKRKRARPRRDADF